MVRVGAPPPAKLFFRALEAAPGIFRLRMRCSIDFRRVHHRFRGVDFRPPHHPAHHPPWCGGWCRGRAPPGAPPRWCVNGQLIDFDRKSMEIGRTRRAESIGTHFEGGADPSRPPAPPLPVFAGGAEFTFSSSQLSEGAEKTQFCTLNTILGGAPCPETVQKHLFLCLCPGPTLADRWGPKWTSPTPAPPIFVISARFCVDLACFERFLNFDPEHWASPLRAENGGWCAGWCT